MVQQYVYIMTFMNIDTHRISILYYLAASGGELTQREIKEKAGDMAHIDCHHLSQSIIKNEKVFINLSLG